MIVLIRNIYEFIEALFLSRRTIYTITIAFIIPPLFVVHFSRWLLDQCWSLEFNSLTATPVHVGIWFWCYAVHYWNIKLLYLVMYEHTTTWSQQKNNSQTQLPCCKLILKNVKSSSQLIYILLYQNIRSILRSEFRSLCQITC